MQRAHRSPAPGLRTHQAIQPQHADRNGCRHMHIYLQTLLACVSASAEMLS